LRWGWEMNGDWEPWSGAQNGGSSGGAASFRAAWHHIHDIFSEVGAWNVVWVWSPNSGDLPHARWNHFSNYYPGDRYVDWVGIDGFNWGASHSWPSWTTIPSTICPTCEVSVCQTAILIPAPRSDT